jgi:hypothetical protein
MVLTIPVTEEARVVAISDVIFVLCFNRRFSSNGLQDRREPLLGDLTDALRRARKMFSR